MEHEASGCRRGGRASGAGLSHPPDCRNSDEYSSIPAPTLRKKAIDVRGYDLIRTTLGMLCLATLMVGSGCTVIGARFGAALDTRQRGIEAVRPENVGSRIEATGPSGRRHTGHLVAVNPDEAFFVVESRPAMLSGTELDTLRVSQTRAVSVFVETDRVRFTLLGAAAGLLVDYYVYKAIAGISFGE